MAVYELTIQFFGHLGVALLVCPSQVGTIVLKIIHSNLMEAIPELVHLGMADFIKRRYVL